MNNKIFLIMLTCAVLLTGCSSTTIEIDSAPVPLATTTEPEVTELSAPSTTEKIKPTFPHTDTETSTVTESETQPNYEFSLYDALYYEISQFHTSMKFNRKIETQDVSYAINELERTHPEIFWINGYTMRYNDTYAEITLKVMNNYPPETLQKMSDELNQKIDSVLQEINATGSDYDKALAVHDYLVSHSEYDEAAVSQGKGLWSTAYGCLLQRSAVCQGYAQAFQILMNRLGIECGMCSGDAKGEPHAWNYVKLNQKYYWVDVTWDDPVSENDLDWIHHSYFLMNDAMLARSRTFSNDGQFIPECSDLSENYFVRNGNYLTEYSFSEIDSRLTAHVDEGRIEIMFSTPEAYQTAIADLFSSESIWNAQIFQSSGGTINYQADDDMYILRLMFNINS